MKKVTVSAPGKLMLLGEHAVVYNRPCLVTAVGQRMRIHIELTNDLAFSMDAPDVDVSAYSKPMHALGRKEIPKGAKFVEIAVKNFSEKYPLTSGLKIITQSEFSSQYGFGSSSASAVCVLKALSELSGKKLSDKELFELAYKTIIEVQTVGSGFDVAAATYGGILYYMTGGRVIEPLVVKELPLVVCYSGVKADTAQIVKEVRKQKELYPKKIDKLFDDIVNLVEQAKIALLDNDWEQVGKYMDKNQEYLRELGVSTDKLENLIAAAKNAGAWGAKLAGAGGGDCMIALVSPDKKIAVVKALTEVGGEVIPVETGVEGVKKE